MTLHFLISLLELVFYGGNGGIEITKPGTTHHGEPLKKLNMGKTLLDKETVLEYIENMREIYRAEKYNLLEFNCKFLAFILTL